MTRSVNKLITFVLVGVFALSFMLPTLQGPMGVKLSGMSVYGLHLATVNFIESISDYVVFLFTALTNLWVIILLIWSVRKKVKLLPTIILGLLAIVSALSWLFNMVDGSVLLIGYWIWILSILLVVGFDIYRSVKKIEF